MAGSCVHTKSEEVGDGEDPFPGALAFSRESASLRRPTSWGINAPTWLTFNLEWPNPIETRVQGTCWGQIKFLQWDMGLRKREIWRGSRIDLAHSFNIKLIQSMVKRSMHTNVSYTDLYRIYTFIHSVKIHSALSYP